MINKGNSIEGNDYEFPNYEIKRDIAKFIRKQIYIILHNIRSAHNVGSIFRTAEAAGAEKIYLAGYTPAPLDRFGKIRPEIAKTALGAEKTIVWEQYKDIGKLITLLRTIHFPSGDRISIVAVEQSVKAINYKKFKPHFPVVLVFGNEVRGISHQILKKCDQIIEIPMLGKKESLNVSVSAGIVLFSLV